MQPSVERNLVDEKEEHRDAAKDKLVDQKRNRIRYVQNANSLSRKSAQIEKKISNLPPPPLFP